MRAVACVAGEGFQPSKRSARRLVEVHSGSVRQARPFVKLVKSAEEYSDTYARMPQDKTHSTARLIDKDAAAPKWEDMVAKLTLCEAFMREISEHTWAPCRESAQRSPP